MALVLLREASMLLNDHLADSREPYSRWLRQPVFNWERLAGEAQEPEDIIIRRVKCDESRPACNNCHKTGRICDGYGNKGAKEAATVPSLLGLKLYQQTSALITGCHADFLLSTEERRCYEYFQNRTRYQINFAFGSSTQVHQLMLQASHTNQSTKHTVIALGSLAEHLSETKVLSDTVLQNNDRLRYAHSQYLIAIGQLQKEMSEVTTPQTEIVLTSCLLLSLFDFLGGEDVHARVHLAAAINILRRCYPTELDYLTNQSNSPTHQPNLLIRDFARIFTVMDFHAAIWLGLSTFHSTPMLPHELHEFPHPPSKVPLDLDSISTCLSYHMARANSFHHDNAPKYSATSTYSSQGLPFHIQAERLRYLHELEQWSSTLSAYVATRPSLTATTPPTADLEHDIRVALLRMNYNTIHTSLSTFLFPRSPQLYAPFTPAFAAILTDAKMILHPPPQLIDFTTPANPASPPVPFHHGREHHGSEKRNHGSRDLLLRAIAANVAEPDANNMSVLAFVPGVIMPLFAVATKCTDLGMAWEAVRLLEGKVGGDVEVGIELGAGAGPWREGAWDSCTMARIARRELEKRSTA